MFPVQILSGIYLGWALGSNDSSNVFGTAVASKSIKFVHAIVLCAVFVFIGSITEGYGGLETLGNLTRFTLEAAFVASLSAAMTVTLLTLLKLPVSTSQAIIGAIVGIGFLKGNLDTANLNKIIICWVSTPIGAALLAVILYKTIGFILEKLPINIFTRDKFLKFGMIAAGCYGSFSLGANNVANVTGVYAASGVITTDMAVIIGGASIAMGALSFSKNVMATVGKKLVMLDSFSAFIAILSEAVTVHIFALIGVPVSVSHAIIGAVLGIGILKGMQTVHVKTLLLIVFGWLGTPLIAFGFSIALRLLFVS